MNRYWNKQNIEFIWVTDGAGWKSTLKPLREYFDNYIIERRKVLETQYDTNTLNNFDEILKSLS